MRETLGYNKNNINREINDFYATPTKEVENILKYEELKGVVLEPCCGMGHMCEGIKTSGFNGKVISTDLINRGYGEWGLDFLSEDYPYIKI